MIEHDFIHNGNYVLHHGQLCEVKSVSTMTEINTDGVIMVKPIHRLDIDYVYAEAGELEPIEITQEWIDRLRVSGFVTNGFSVKKTEYGRFGLYLHHDHNVRFTGKFFGFVHEVQNTMESLWNKKIKII